MATKKCLAEIDDKLNYLTENINISIMSMSSLSSVGIKLEKYSGTESENPEEWLRKFDTYTDFHGWKDGKKYSAFQLMLGGIADLWYKTLAEDVRKDFEEVRKLFQTKFERKTPTWVEVEGLMSQKQGIDETVDKYIMRLKTYAAELHLQQETYMTAFIRGLRPEIQESVANHNPKTAEETEEWAKVAEKLTSGKRNRQNQNVDNAQNVNLGLNGIVVEQAAQIEKLSKSVEKMENRFDQVMNFLVKNQSDNSNDIFVRSDLGVPICGKCKMSGHTEQGCRARQLRTCYFCHQGGM
jgi:hypothetical protein